MKAIVFDVDGTLVDSSETIAYYGNRTLEAFGLETLPTETYESMLGQGAAVLVEKMALATGASVDEVQRILVAYSSSYDEKPLYLTRSYPGIKALLENLKRNGYVLIAFSNKPHSTCVQVIDGIFGKGYFDGVAGQREGIPRKPNPMGLLKMLKELKVRPQDCLYLGDTEIDVETAAAVPMEFVAITWGYRSAEQLEKAGAENFVDTPDQVYSYLK